MKYIFQAFAFLFFVNFAYAQQFTHADTLRGSNGPGRDWWDVTKYDLNIKFNIADSTISGYNVINFNLLKTDGKFFQIDLQEPLVIDSVIVDFGFRIRRYDPKNPISTDVTPNHRKLIVTRDGNAWFARLDTTSVELQRRPVYRWDDTLNFRKNLIVYYHGKPHVARTPPWDGGLVWSRDKQNNPFIGVACQGTGASIWYPCKDYQGDEPDSATMRFTAPDSLMIISNGRMVDSVNNGNGTHTITWTVKDPINNYDISPYIGKYTHFGQVYQGEDGPLTMDYWPLDSNLNKAKEQFKQAPMMMKAFEYWFGPYPFYKDGYKLVEAPYLGMEHQSAVAYGNHYKNGYLGRDLSGSGWGLKWDFIIIHESGHEWFGNNITTADIADMWVHEGFTNYSETLFTEYYFGKKAAKDYIIGIRKNIRNDRPIIGSYGVNNEGSGDMYYKAANMIHMIRQIINDDQKFRTILRGMNKDFRHQIVTGRQIEDYINEKSKIDFDFVFKQYLETTQIPVLEYKKEKDKLIFRWSNCVDGFNMPIRIYNDKNDLIWIYPSDTFQAVRGVSDMRPDDNFYVDVKEVQNKDSVH